MSETIIKAPKKMEFAQTQEYFDQFRKVFGRTLAFSFLSDPEFKKIEDIPIGMLVEKSPLIQTQQESFIRFCVFLISEGEVDTSREKNNHASLSEKLMSLDIPQSFSQKVFEFFEAYTPRDLIEKLPEEDKKSLEKVSKVQKKKIQSLKDDIFYFHFIHSLATILEKLKNIPDGAIIDSLMNEEDFKGIMLRIYKSSLFIQQEHLEEKEIVMATEEDIENMPVDELHYYNLMFDVGLKSKEAIIEEAHTLMKNKMSGL